GGVFCFGSARFYGSTGGLRLNLPVVGMAAVPDGTGYWLVASDGGVFCFGSAGFHGSTGGRGLRALAGGIATTPSGGGYWIWGQDGSAFAFGDAPDLGDYPRLAPPARTLPSDGIDAFAAMSVEPGAGYTLWAASPLGPPPGLAPFRFAGPVPPAAHH
ncbi:MAG: hypothetical protein ACHQNA_00295, partial [Acidimicrobiales bacterium]